MCTRAYVHTCPGVNVPRFWRAAGGFSLVELLIAATIIASGSALLISALVASNRSSSLRIEPTIINQAMASQLALLEDELRFDSTTSGLCLYPYENFNWKIHWEKMSLSPIAQVALTISDEKRSANVVTYRKLIEP